MGCCGSCGGQDAIKAQDQDNETEDKKEQEQTQAQAQDTDKRKTVRKINSPFCLLINPAAFDQAAGFFYFGLQQ